MDVTESIRIFGLGSYFEKERHQLRDIDILLLHRSTSLASVEAAINVKFLLGKQIYDADIVMLSEHEEHDLAFIGLSNAVLLGTVQSDQLIEQARAISQQILARKFSFGSISD